ncbi:MAG TPA: N-acyl homoserine lactonase family protein [Burkholderiales bacterium]|nr:N-acyl homoserine lactonase family protein [Burkholderiales bacterium]
MKTLFAGAMAVILLAACASVERPASVERLYVIDCGENHVKDLSPWTTPSDAGKPWVFSDNCYLIKHAKGWMLWDSGLPDQLAALPNGQTAANGRITAYRKKPLVESLREVGLSPADIGVFAMSHSHPDHSGNADLFPASTIYMQRTEYDAAFGPDAKKYGLINTSLERLRHVKVVKLDGDFDVFGDGSVVIKSTPGHTPGHQSLFVRLPKTGPVLLSGDLVHLQSNWQARRVPSINYSVEQSLRSMNAMDAFIKATGAKLWINHDFAQSSGMPKAPEYVE